jgi:hypothetical protein
VGHTHVRVSVCLCARGSRCALHSFAIPTLVPLCVLRPWGPFCTPVPFPLPSSHSQLPVYHPTSKFFHYPYPQGFLKPASTSSFIINMSYNIIN